MPHSELSALLLAQEWNTMYTLNDTIYKFMTVLHTMLPIIFQCADVHTLAQQPATPILVVVVGWLVFFSFIKLYLIFVHPFPIHAITIIRVQCFGFALFRLCVTSITCVLFSFAIYGHANAYISIPCCGQCSFQLQQYACVVACVSDSPALGPLAKNHSLTYVSVNACNKCICDVMCGRLLPFYHSHAAACCIRKRSTATML